MKPAHLLLLLAALVLPGCGIDVEGEASDETTSELQGKGLDLPNDEDDPEDSVELADAPKKKVLEVKWKGQETGYWCGPGSTRIALSAKLSSSNLPSQQTLASLMGTTKNGTDHIGLPAKALNKYLGTSFKSRSMSDPPSSSQRSQLKKDILARIGAGYPMVANVISGWRPAGYPSGTIYHYVAIVGYDEGGNKVLIADPAAEGSGGSRWKSVPRTYWVSIENLGTWIGGKGYTG